MIEQGDNYTPRKARVIIQGFDVLDVVSYIGRLVKRHQATLLSQLEMELDKKEFLVVRKLILDSTNSLARGIVRAIFGEIESG